CARSPHHHHLRIDGPALDRAARRPRHLDLGPRALRPVFPQGMAVRGCVRLPAHRGERSRDRHAAALRAVFGIASRNEVATHRQVARALEARGHDIAVYEGPWRGWLDAFAAARLFAARNAELAVVEGPRSFAMFGWARLLHPSTTVTGLAATDAEAAERELEGVPSRAHRYRRGAVLRSGGPLDARDRRPRQARGRASHAGRVARPARPAGGALRAGRGLESIGDRARRRNRRAGDGGERRASPGAACRGRRARRPLP